VVFGMPGAVMASGAYDSAMDLKAIANAINEKASSVDLITQKKSS